MNKEIHPAHEPFDNIDKGAKPESLMKNIPFIIEKLRTEIENSTRENGKVQLKEMESFCELIDLLIIESYSNKDAIDKILSYLKKSVAKDVLEQIITETIKILVSKGVETEINYERDEITKNARKLVSCTLRP